MYEVRIIYKGTIVKEKEFSTLREAVAFVMSIKERVSAVNYEVKKDGVILGETTSKTPTSV